MLIFSQTELFYKIMTLKFFLHVKRKKIEKSIGITKGIKTPQIETIILVPWGALEIGRPLSKNLCAEDI